MRKAIVFGIAAIPVALAIGPAMKAYGPMLTQEPAASAGPAVAAADPASKIGPERSSAQARKAKAAAAAKAQHKVARVHGHGTNASGETSDGGAQSYGGNGTSRQH
jgi:hypothetical protein